MKFWLAVLLLVPAFVFAEETVEIPEEYVTAEQVKELRENGETVVIAFATKHCPHCTKFGEQIPKIRESLKESEINAKVHKLDTRDDANKEFVGEHDIQGVPTVYVFVGQEKGIRYSGSREVVDLVNFVKKVQNLKVELLATKEQIEAFKAKTPALIAVVTGEEANTEHLTVAAKENLDINIAYTTEEVATDLVAGLYVFREDGSLSLASAEIPTESEKLNKWIKMASVNSITSFPKGASALFSSGVNNIIFVIDTAPGILAEKWLVDIAEKFRGQVVIGTVDVKEENTAHALEFFGVDPEVAEPTVRAFHDTKHKQYKMNEAVNAESLDAWLTALLAGEVPPHMKSQSVPEDWDQEPVKIIVGSTFEEIALNKEKDVFVFFHAPWCGHCKKLSPDWEKLAESFKDNDKLVIAKLDATSNDIEDGNGEIRGFPTLRLYKAGDNKMVEFNGDRTLEGLQKFLKEEVGQEASETHEEL